MKVSKPVTKPVIYLFFIIGLLAAASFRMLIVFKYLSPEWIRPIWYSGVIGYIAFFCYRFYITEKRRRAIRESGLIETLSTNQPIEPIDREHILYILRSVMVSRENWNYLAIFLLSILAIFLDLILAATRG